MKLVGVRLFMMFEYKKTPCFIILSTPPAGRKLMSHTLNCPFANEH
jgi:hypothetical protein